MESKTAQNPATAPGPKKQMKQMPPDEIVYRFLYMNLIRNGGAELAKKLIEQLKVPGNFFIEQFYEGDEQPVWEFNWDWMVFESNTYQLYQVADAVRKHFQEQKEEKQPETAQPATPEEASEEQPQQKEEAKVIRMFDADGKVVEKGTEQ